MLDKGCPIPRKDGKECRGIPTTSGYCPSHDPNLGNKIREGRARGGRNKARTARAQKLLLGELETLDDVLTQAVAGVYRGTLSPAQGSSIAALASAKVRLREIALKMAEQTELKDRILRLEEQIYDIGLKNHTNGKATRRV